MAQYGFFIDQSRCTGCNSCTVSCAQWHNILPGPVKWMRVYQWEKGTFPNTRLHILPVNCYHCENAVCIKACPNKAIYKEDTFGAVLVDQDKCKGERKCWLVCPYGAPQYASDDLGETMSKCNMCIDRLTEGLKPICVLSCSMRALEFGPLSDLQKKYGNIRRLEDMPSDKITNPSVVFKPSSSKSEVLTYDSKRALELWRKRNPDGGEDTLISDFTDITNPPEEIIGRNRLVLKTKTVKEKIYYTTDDE